MARTFLVRKPESAVDDLIDAIAGRENELHFYDFNVDSYTAQLAALNATGLPAEWPAALAKYKSKDSQQIAALGGSQADMELASKLNHRDRLTTLLFTEKSERAKSELVYDQLKSRLPTSKPDVDAALARYATRLAAQKAKNP